MAPTSCNRVVYLDKVFLIFVTFPSLASFNFESNYQNLPGFWFFLVQINALLAAYWDHSISIKIKLIK